MSVTAVSEVPEIVSEEAQKKTTRFSKRNEGDSVTTVEGSPTRVTIDIETVRAPGIAEAEIDLQDSGHVELLCVGVGYQPSPGLPVDVDVLFRNERTIRAEYELLDAVCGWLKKHDPDEVLTYHGDFDRRHLRGQAEQCDQELDADPVKQRIEPYLKDDIFRDLGLSMSLESATETEPTYWDIYHHDVEILEWHEKLEKLKLC